MYGDFEPEKLLVEIRKRLISKPLQGQIKRIRAEEPKEIVRDRIENIMEVSTPLFVIGIKDTIAKRDDLVKKHIAIEILLNMIIGKSSSLYKKLYDDGLLITEPFLEYEFGEDYAHVAISGQSKNPDLVLKNFKDEINRLKDGKLEEIHFNRIKNMLYGIAVKEFNNVSDIARMFVSDYFKGINSFEYIEGYKKATIEHTKQILEELFLEDRMVLSIIKNK